MRIVAATALILGTVATTAAVGAAVLPEARNVTSPGDRAFNESWARLKDAVFVAPTEVVAPTDEPVNLAPVAPVETFSPAVSSGVATPFAQTPQTGTALDRPTLLAGDRYVPGRGVARWQVTELAVPSHTGNAVDAIKVSIGRVAVTPGALPVRPGDRVQTDAEAYEMTYTRGWPQVVAAGRWDLGFIPHAGVGISNSGGQAEAGAMVRLSKRAGQIADRLGVSDGRKFGDQGRWYVFGAASERTVGLNLTRNDAGKWSRAGFSTDTQSGMISDIQAGVGWRKGSVQASLGWLRRKVKGAQTLMGWDNRKDSVFALSISIKPAK